MSDTPVIDPADPAETDWEAIIATVAPTLGLAVSGPLMTLALTHISIALGLDPKATSVQIATALEIVTIEQLRALQAAERGFLAQMKSLKIPKQRLSSEQLIEEDGMRPWFPEAFAMTISFLFFSLLTFFAWHQIPAGPNETVLNVMLGAVAASFATVVNYFFGSTRSSSRKDLMLYNSKPS